MILHCSVDRAEVPWTYFQIFSPTVTHSNRVLKTAHARAWLKSNQAASGKMADRELGGSRKNLSAKKTENWCLMENSFPWGKIKQSARC